MKLRNQNCLVLNRGEFHRAVWSDDAAAVAVVAALNNNTRHCRIHNHYYIGVGVAVAAADTVADTAGSGSILRPWWMMGCLLFCVLMK